MNLAKSAHNITNKISPGTQRQFVAKFRGFCGFALLDDAIGRGLQSCLPAENIPQIR